MEASHTGVTFENTLVEDAQLNVLLYEYLYNGGGVAAGDFNGDGWEDLYFTANTSPSKLYLNERDFRFTDITETAGVGGRKTGWRTGVTVVDINQDGRLDLYLSYSGPFPREQRTAQLFVNQGNDSNGSPLFRDEAVLYGLNDQGFTTQSAFFDYDRDGDLDVVLIHHNPRRLDHLNEALVNQMLNTPDSLRGIKLYRNDACYFRDATAESGLKNTLLSYGLGVAVSDLNDDGWPDLYVSSDYLVPDYLYMNSGRGTFIDQTGQALRHTAKFSMGNDIADINNDGLPDIMTLDMLPEDNERQKLLFAPDNYEHFAMDLRLGFHAQFMRNMLQINRGGGQFSEVGQLAGLASTDWSWAPLLADYDNDGHKDLFVTNGYRRDFTNMDFLKYMNGYFQSRGSAIQKEDMIGVVEKMPASNVKNYAFRNEGDIQFSNVSQEWGLAESTNSNGATYADLDNDGDLDIIVNNLNAAASLYRNNGSPEAHHLRFKLRGKIPNRLGIGTKIKVFTQGQGQLYEQNLSRGFQSSVSPILHVGLGGHTRADSVWVIWPGGDQQRLYSVKADTTLTVQEQDARGYPSSRNSEETVFKATASLLPFSHQQPEINDFKRQGLLINGQSFSGPGLASGDVNGDGRTDVFVGGGMDQTGTIFLQNANGSFTTSTQPALEENKGADDTDALFLDVDGDGDQDLYVCSGGYGNFDPADLRLNDRLYINNGGGVLMKSSEALPEMLTSSSCVRSSDWNGDGFPDLFVGGRVIPGRYPEAPRSYLLQNDGRGRFRDVTAQMCPALVQPGMITSAAFADFNGDKRPDLVTVGEWMPIQIWVNQQGATFGDDTNRYLPKTYSGWWNTLLIADLNADGHPDLMAGNQGLNGPFRVSDQQPSELIYKDFDDNGTVDPILCAFIQGRSYPYLSRDELLRQLPGRGRLFPNYKAFSTAVLTDVFSAEELTDASRLRVNGFETMLWLSGPGGVLKEAVLPIETQFAPVFTLVSHDFTGNGHPDLLLGGNITHARLRMGQYDASYGTLLRNDGKGNFKAVPLPQSGLQLTGDVRSMVVLQQPGQPSSLLVGTNGQSLRTYHFKAVNTIQ